MSVDVRRGDAGGWGLFTPGGSGTMLCTAVWLGWSTCRVVLIAKNDFLIASLQRLVSFCLFSFGVTSSKTPK